MRKQRERQTDRHAEGEEMDKAMRSSSPRGKEEDWAGFPGNQGGTSGGSSPRRDSGAWSLSSQFVLTADLS